MFHPMKDHAILRNMTATTGPSTPRATDRGLSLVSAIADHPQGLTLADAARYVDLSPSTTLRQLRALESSGFTERSDDGLWMPGPELYRIAQQLSKVSSLASSAQVVLTELASSTGESSYLAEPSDSQHAVYTGMAPGTHAIRHVSWLGRPVPRAGTAIGAALVPSLDASGTVTVSDAVEPGVTAVAAPVIGPNGVVLAALSVVGPSFRLRGAHLAVVRRAVRSSAEGLSALLGAPMPAALRTRGGPAGRNPRS